MHFLVYLSQYWANKVKNMLKQSKIKGYLLWNLHIKMVNKFRDVCSWGYVQIPTSTVKSNLPCCCLIIMSWLVSLTSREAQKGARP